MWKTDDATMTLNNWIKTILWSDKHKTFITGNFKDTFLVIMYWGVGI